VRSTPSAAWPTPTSSMDPREFQFVFAGFCAAWIIIVIYVLTLTSRNRRLRQELDRVRKMMEKR
jgi:CcmD family protein